MNKKIQHQQRAKILARQYDDGHFDFQIRLIHLDLFYQPTILESQEIILAGLNSDDLALAH